MFLLEIGGCMNFELNFDLERYGIIIVVYKH
jgi:hypothetical protein